MKMRAAIVIAAMAGAALAGAPAFGTVNDYYANYPKTPRDHQLADLSKTICSFHFISGQDIEAIIAEHMTDGNGFSPDFTKDHVALSRNAVIDPEKKIVRVSDGKLQASARYYGDQGCVILPDYRDDAYFTPKKVRDPRVAANGPSWPDGGLIATGSLPKGYDAAKLRAARDALFAPDADAYQFAVVHKGRLLIEHYADKLGKDVPVQNWSMGKSIIGTLTGMLIQRGAFKATDPAPIPEWNALPNDKRARIRIIDLLQMSSGLRCSRSRDPDQLQVAEDDNVYGKAVDITRLAITRPVVAPPGTRANYSNCDMQSLGYIIRRTIEGAGEDYLSWPYRNLYDKLGMSGMVSEVDAYGNFHLTGYDFGTARDWAKLGMLYLADGVWKGERILPEGWAKLVATPAPAFEHVVSTPDSQLVENELNTGYPSKASLVSGNGMYGGTFWLNSRGALPVPKDAFFARGASTSTALIVPSKDLVVVMLTGNEKVQPTQRGLKAALELIVAALPAQ